MNKQRKTLTPSNLQNQQFRIRLREDTRPKRKIYALNRPNLNRQPIIIPLKDHLNKSQIFMTSLQSKVRLPQTRNNQRNTGLHNSFIRVLLATDLSTRKPYQFTRKIVSNFNKNERPSTLLKPEKPQMLQEKVLSRILMRLGANLGAKNNQITSLKCPVNHLTINRLLQLAKFPSGSCRVCNSDRQWDLWRGQVVQVEAAVLQILTQLWKRVKILTHECLANTAVVNLLKLQQRDTYRTVSANTRKT